MNINRLKIKLLDKLIDRNIDKIMELASICKKENIRLNQKDNMLVQKIKAISKENITLEDKKDKIITMARTQTQEKYNKYLEELKSTYRGYKYKIIDRNTQEALYSNDIKKYIRDFNFEIYCILEGREYKKQGRVENRIYPVIKSDFEYIEFKAKDTIQRVLRQEVYSKNNELVKLYFEKEKKGSKVIYNKSFNNIFFSVNGVSIVKVNKNSFELDQISKAIDVFESDKELQELFNKYNKEIWKKEKEVKRTIEDRFKGLLTAYDETINNHTDLKEVMRNIDELRENKKYSDRNGQKLFYKEFKINKENWINYMSNYRRWNYLRTIDIKEIEKISKADDKFWRYPERVLRWKDYKRIRLENNY